MLHSWSSSQVCIFASREQPATAGCREPSSPEPVVSPQSRKRRPSHRSAARRLTHSAAAFLTTRWSRTGSSTALASPTQKLGTSVHLRRPCTECRVTPARGMARATNRTGKHPGVHPFAIEHFAALRVPLATGPKLAIALSRPGDIEFRGDGRPDAAQFRMPGGFVKRLGTSLPQRDCERRPNWRLGTGGGVVWIGNAAACVFSAAGHRRGPENCLRPAALSQLPPPEAAGKQDQR